MKFATDFVEIKENTMEIKGQQRKSRKTRRRYVTPPRPSPLTAHDIIFVGHFCAAHQSFSDDAFELSLSSTSDFKSV